MQTTYSGLYGQVISDTIDVTVNSAFGGAGQAVAYAGQTDSVEIWNRDENFDIEYKIGSGDWQALHKSTGTFEDIDLSVTTITIRLAEFAPAGIKAQIIYYGLPKGVYGVDALENQNGDPVDISAALAAIGSLSVTELHPNGKYKTWVQNGLPCSSTLDIYGRTATLTLGASVHTFNWDGNGAGLPTVTVA